MALDFKNKEDIATVQINEDNMIIIGLVPDTNGGIPQIDVRKHFINKNEEIQRTKKGIVLESGIWTQVISAVKTAQEKAAKS